MKSDAETEFSKDDFLPPGPQEFRKRRREIIIVLLVSVLFVLLTWFEIRLFATSQQLPFDLSDMKQAEAGIEKLLAAQTR